MGRFLAVAAQNAALIRLLAGFIVRAERVTGDKETRARAFASQVNAGNYSLVRASWNTAFVEELRTFPGKHDDQVDAGGDAQAELSLAQIPYVPLAQGNYLTGSRSAYR
jgi:predicted phage terminase large subunit-like protein